jgi:mannosylglycoprotein endo-beta-mannosidase
MVKLDIAKAFDSVSWTYLLDMLRARGFSQRWCDWIALLLSTASTRVILNGNVGDRIRHRRGLRQGDPLSPFLFILAMEPLHRILSLAADEGVLSRLRGRANDLRTSLYADDAVFFINPVKVELQAVRDILARFGEVTGLHVNFAKTAVIPLRCEGLDVANIVAPLGARIAALPASFWGCTLASASSTRLTSSRSLTALLAA